MSQAKTETTPKAIYLKDYQIPDFRIDKVDLYFDLSEEATKVRARMEIKRNNRETTDQRPLVLDGVELELLYIALDGQPLYEDDFSIEQESLTIPEVPDNFILELVTQIRPQDNTSLNGLYTSGGNFCTQCESQGFRKIMFFLDRPDVLARYTTTIVADKEKYPVLLSNGNLVEQGDRDKTRHWVTWEDPFPKPSYLFALVAGNLAHIDDEFKTLSGRKVALHIYVQPHNVDKCDHAMRSLKKAMQWDEKVYGREYDLDVYNIVAVDDFNMGAMENKGLNVFNSKYVLASPETATDSDYQYIEGVIGHEYFHNWSGNRVTCRDWFQLSLKEGFTVFRDQEFSADMSMRGVKRIQDVNVLRTHQFREDSGPMAHPVRPESYVEINNFYTLTVYNKGAEVIRMLSQLLGAKGFRKGTDLYFSRHDGQSVTTDDFVKAMEDANDIDLSQFRLWYSQAGTPELNVAWEYNPWTKKLTMTVKQHCPPTPGQPEKQPFHIPLALGLLDKDGTDIPLKLTGEDNSVPGTRVMPIRKPEETFEFVDVPREPVPSLLRGFSAPVKLHATYSAQERYFLMANDSDQFNRWEAGQQLIIELILDLISKFQKEKPLEVNAEFIEAFDNTLKSPKLDKAFIAQALTLPSENYLVGFMDVADPVAIHEACRFMRKTLAGSLQKSFTAIYQANASSGPYRIDPESIGRRSLKNLCLGYLIELDEGDDTSDVRQLCLDQFRSANNMTDVFAALACLANTDCPERTEVLTEFYDKWKEDGLVVDKWLSIQATSRLPNALEHVHALTKHPAFNVKNPNKVRALIGAFAQGNPVRFQDDSGGGYALLGEYVLKIDPLNPQVAARLVGAFTQWRKYDQKRQGLMKAQLEQILKTPKLSKDVYEIVSKTLA
jgi:aminopeptidase N